MTHMINFITVAYICCMWKMLEKLNFPSSTRTLSSSARQLLQYRHENGSTFNFYMHFCFVDIGEIVSSIEPSNYENYL